jgi:formamidase
MIHPGLIGCLPDRAMLDLWNAREQNLIDTNPSAGLANPPSAGTAHMGKMTGEARAKAAAEGARTVPPRELKCGRQGTCNQ